MKSKMRSKLVWRIYRSGAAVALFLLAAVYSLSAADPFVWVTMAACPLPRFEAVGGAADGKLYQFSGFYTYSPSIKATNECDAYDPATNVWTRLASTPQAITHSGQVADTDQANNRTFWLAGGFLGDHPGPTTRQVWKYSITNNSWAAGPKLPAQRAGGALVKLGRELHFFGGGIRAADGTWVDYGTHWTFDLDNGTAWRTKTAEGQLLAPMPNPRNHLGGVALNGKLYAIGGQHHDDERTGAQSEVDVYDPGTNKWTQAAPMPRPIGHVTANVLVRNGRINVTSGVTTNSAEIANVIEYNPLTNAWTELPPLPGARQSPVSGAVGDQIIVTCGLHDGLHAQTWITKATAASGTWQAGAALPLGVGEVSTGVINGVLYVVGGDTHATMAYNLNTGVWRSGLAPRPLQGDHHAAAVVNGKLYLIGGLGGGSAGQVQIYDPSSNSWSLGSPAPYAGGSVSIGLIAGKIYIAGGIVGNTTVNAAAIYDPATDTWSPIAPMPAGRNHAAGGSDGHKFFTFGGRTGGNTVSVGFASVQIYDPATNTWAWSGEAGSTIPPLPQKRGGMGKAAFYKNEFYVMGGETTATGTGQVSGNVYNRVDVYNPVSKIWRLETMMPTARHGIFPVAANGKIFVAGGGVQAAHSFSTVFEIFSR